MFEKEAEEIAKDIYIHHFDDDVNYPDVLKAITVGVQKGAEHGYNKANEWHWIKDGDLPKEGTVCLTARTIISGNVAYDVCSYYEGLFGENWFAWKEIVLPKEMKEK